MATTLICMQLHASTDYSRAFTVGLMNTTVSRITFNVFDVVRPVDNDGVAITTAPISPRVLAYYNGMNHH